VSPSRTPYPPEAFTNRELSWLDFDARVLEEARDSRNPLLERLRFLAISANNLDEFFEVRVAGLCQAVASGIESRGPDGLAPGEALEKVVERTRTFVADQYSLWNGELCPALAAEGIRVGLDDAIWERHGADLTAYLMERLHPVLTPLTIDPAHPFPRVENKLLCVAGLIRGPESKLNRLAVVAIPRVMPRVLPVRGAETPTYVFLGELVRRCFGRIFSGYEVLGTTEFRVTRNSDLYVNEEDAKNLLDAISEELRDRRKGDAVRLELAADSPKELETMLVAALGLSDDLVFRVPGPINLNRLMNVYSAPARPDLKFPQFLPVEPAWVSEGANFFDRLKEQDLLLHHPFDSFNPVAGFVQAAASDPKVLAIKLTLYRTGHESPVVSALLAAAREGKQVTAVVELKARFEEATNIQWAREMEDAGVQVVFGLVGLKTHCKLALLVRDEGDRLRRYAHLGTGNYNPTTAKIYTDLSLLTAREDVTNDVAEVFNLLTTHIRPLKMKRLVVAPHEMLETILGLIEGEIQEAKAGKPARIVAKMNALVDRDVIETLYDASRSGVEIDLIVRGICCLKPGVPGLSERIRVRSVVGRYLEHSRIYVFHAGGAEKVLVGSADLMPRNLRGRVEVLFPIDDPVIAAQVRNEILSVYLEPRPKVRILHPDGVYRPISKEEWVEEIDAHTVFMIRAQKQIEKLQRVVERPRKPRGRGDRARRQAQKKGPGPFFAR